MSFRLTRGGGGTTIELGSEDPFEVTFRPAKPVLDAVIEMLEPLRWLDQRRRSRLALFEPEHAAELINLIPRRDRIAKAAALFLEAEDNSAPEAWVHVAVGLMLQSQPDPNAVDGDAYRCAITDGAFGDPEVWGQYGPGFSAAVIVRTIRQVRREYDELPSPGRFLNLCARQRAQFKTWNADMLTLLDLRYAAEDAVEEIGKPLLLDYDPEEDVPF